MPRDCRMAIQEHKIFYKYKIAKVTYKLYSINGR